MPNSPQVPQSRRLLPSTKALAAFEAVARLKSFTRAASELSLSQSAVSKQISALEQQLGLRLFESKRTHGIGLTPAGAQYFENVRQILADLSTTTASFIASVDDMRSLRLGVPATFGSRWLIPRIGRLFESEPDISIEFATRMNARLEPNFGNLDASIEFAQEPDTSHVWRPLMPWIVTAAASTGLIREAGLEKPGDISRVSILLHSSDVALWKDWSASMSTKQTSFKTIIFESYPMVFQAAVVGLGVAIAPTVLMQRELANGELVKPFHVELRSPHKCYFVYPGDRGGRKTLARFEDWLFSPDIEA